MAAIGIPHAAASVVLRIAVQHLDPIAVGGNPHPVVHPGHGRQIRRHEQHGFILRGDPHEAQHTVIGRIRRHPLEPSRVVIPAEQGALLVIQGVQIAHPLHQPRSQGLLGEVPVERAVVIPFAPLAEFPAHEEELLAGLGEHQPVERAKVREFLPALSRHFPEQGTLAVHHLVVGERQHEVLVIGIEYPEREQIVVKFAVDGVFFHVFERIVHPAHVPLHAETQTPRIHGSRDHRPGGGFFRDGLHVGEAAIDFRVQPLEEGDGLVVLPASLFVGKPLALFSRIIEIEHGGHAVDAQPVGVEILQPVDGAAYEEGGNLVTPVIENVALPIGMKPPPGIGVLVKMGPVEIAQPVPVRGEVRRHPVEYHAQAALVEIIDEIHQILRGSEAARGREIAGDLISPRTVEGMLHHRQEFYVGEPHVKHVLGE